MELNIEIKIHIFAGVVELLMINKLIYDKG